MVFGHGKLILLGEHSVVHGRPAIAAALPRGAEAETQPAASARLAVEPWGVAFAADAEQSDPDHERLRRAFCALLDRYPEPPRLAVRVKLSLPGSAGLGGSAALSVAIVRALDAALGIDRSDPEVADLALAAERVFHGNPSGIDSTMAACGGVALYRKGRPLEPIAVARALTLVVGHSGEPGKTHDTVASVGRQLKAEPARVEPIFDEIERLVLSARGALERGEPQQLGPLMARNQELLAALLLSTPRLDAMCRAAASAGALGAKLTGGGGGGCMIALCADRSAAAPVQRALEALGHEAFTIEVTG